MSLAMQNEVREQRKRIDGLEELVAALNERIAALEERPRIGRPPKEQPRA